LADVAAREQLVMLDLRSYVAVETTTPTTNYFPNPPTAGNPGLNLTIPTKALDNYEFGVAAPATTASAPLPTFTITATPKGKQAVDGALTLDSAGVKTPSNKW
jgi:type IV pilus assembly protein PilE